MADKEKPKLHVTFYNHPEPDKKASAEAGRPIYRDVPYIKIRFPGDKHRTIDQPAHGKHRRDPETNQWLTYKDTFPEHWAAFQKAGDDAVVGTPLGELPFLTNAKREELRSLNIYTAEQLASLADRTIAKLGMGFRSLVEQAQAYLDRAEKLVSQGELEKRNKELEDRLAKLEAMLDHEKVTAQGATKAAREAARDALASDIEEKAAELDEGGDLGPGADFENWEDDDIRAFLTDHGKEVSPRAPRVALIKSARAVVRAINEKLAHEAA